MDQLSLSHDQLLERLRELNSLAPWRQCILGPSIPWRQEQKGTPQQPPTSLIKLHTMKEAVMVAMASEKLSLLSQELGLSTLERQ